MQILLSRLLDLFPPSARDGWQSDLPIEHVLTDSRSLIKPEGTLFVAIPTASNNGTRYMRSLYDRGLRWFVASEVPDNMKNLPDALILTDPDPVGVLQKLAQRIPGTGGEVVAITGSTGKTTLKEWLFQMLEPLKNVVRSPRSYNSQIGVPLSMLRITADTEVALIEAGISRKGEMARLRDCISPDTVIITGLGPEHDDGFESLNRKATEKVSLADHESVSKLIYCADNPEIRGAVETLKQKRGGALKIFAWSANTPPAGTSVLSLPDWVKEKARQDSHPAKALANLGNAWAFMFSEEYDNNEIRRAFGRLRPVDTRLNVSEGNRGCIIIHDTYTSDVASTGPALDFMMRRWTPSQKSTVIMTDLMHESGAAGERYEEVARMLSARNIDRFIGVGPEMMAHRHLFAERFRGGTGFYRDTESLLASISPAEFQNEVILLKGAPEYDIHRVAETLEARTHETVLEVNLDAVVRNYNYFKSHLPQQTGIVAMVKASGYGAGSYQLAKTLQDAGAAYLAVAVLDEGLELRNKGITMPIMVMNPRVANYKMMFANRLEPEIYTFSMLHDVIEAARRHGLTDYPIHIKIDTGMHRMGFEEPEIESLMNLISASPEVKVKSVFSHLATADCPDMDDYTLSQLEAFERISSGIVERCAHKVLRHVLNSAGILRFPQYHYDMARLGIGLYGVNTLPPEMEKPLETVSTLRTVVISVKDRMPPQSIGYARKGRIQKPSRVATIPIGYADGMDRHFGNGAVKVLVNGVEAPTIGNICMDACMIDVTGIDCKEGDQVEIFGPGIPLQRLADTLGTIPYEVLTSVSERVKRVYYRE